ncbi:unnamed protein product [Vicia faba]|uniref:Uncharacterized protein n=1 Tax=Vicia faba TaxID=3906 RepID=A0AAV1BA22_VICFA|nr:unnamed protein product [Vicia faba]
MDPRISFSNDFVVSQQQAIKHENIYREAPVSSDFEFSVKKYSMITADQVFFKGMLLPGNECSKKVTLRDELLNDDDSPKWSKSLSRWKERLGLKRGSSKKDKNKNDQRSVVNLEQGETAVNKDNIELFYERDVGFKGK